jgi:hypothetical protein
MSTNRTRRFNRRTAEHLLRGAAAGRGVEGTAAVTSLLGAAAAPARDDELAGQPAALAAFRAARLGPVPQPRRRSVIKSALAQSLTTKIAAFAVAAVAFGGVATAAVTGHLSPHTGPTTPVPPTSSHAAAPVQLSTSDNAERATAGGGPAVPAPDLTGLCHAYTAGAGSDHGKALDNPAFTALITAAGGRDNVAAFCAGLLPSASGKPSGPPTQHDKPTHPTHPSHAGH